MPVLSPSFRRRVSQAIAHVFGKPMSGDGYQLAGASPGGRRLRITDEYLVHRFASWVYIASRLNGTASAENWPPKLYVTTGNGQKAPLRRTKAVPDEVMHDFLKRPAIANIPHFKAAETVEEVIDHPSLTLFRNPNSLTGGSFQLSYLKSLYQDLTGEGLWWVPPDPATGMPMAIFNLPTQWTQVIRTPMDATRARINPSEVDWDNDLPIKGYAFGSNPKFRFFIPFEHIVNFRFPNPLNPLNGFGPTRGMIMSVIRDEDMDEYEDALNRNYGRPDYIVAPKGTDQYLNTEDRRTLAAELNAEHGGLSQAGKAMVASGQMEVHTLGFNLREMAFKDGRPYTRDAIANGFGVPPSLLQAKEVNRSTLESALFQYNKFTVFPRLKMDEQVLNEKYLPMFDMEERGFTVSDRLFFAFDNPVPEDKEFNLKKTESYLTNHVVTINEVREEEGKEPVPWGDEPYSPPSPGLAPFQLAYSLPAAKDQPAKSQSKDSDKVDLEGNGTPVGCKHYVGKGFELEVDQDGNAKVLHCGCGCTKQGEELSGGPVLPLSKDERVISRLANKMYSEQQAAVLAAAVAGNPVSIEFRAVEWAEKFSGDMTKPIARIMLRAGDKALETAGIEAFPWIENPKVQAFIERNTFKFLTKTSDTFEKGFQLALKEGMAEGENMQELTKRLEDYFAGTDYQERANMIARTESARASTHGQVQAWNESGVVTRKIWVGSGSDPCPFCADMIERFGPGTEGIPLMEPFIPEGHTQEIPFGEFDTETNTQRTIKLSHNYEDVIGPPLHPNCRGTLVAVVDEGLE